MKDRSYAIAIAVILAICCLGAYVAVSGFLNTRQTGIAIDFGKAVTPVAIVLATQTAPPSRTAGVVVAPPPTSPFISPPLGEIPTITPGPINPEEFAVPTVAVRPTSPPRLPPSPTVLSCASFQYCGIGGPPSQDPRLSPMGLPCPSAYIWGRVVDKNGAGIPGVRIQFKGPAGEIASVESKGQPDPPGVYNIPAGTTSGNYTLWVLDSGGGRASPQYNVIAPQAYSGAPSCPTRLDFRAQR